MTGRVFILFLLLSDVVSAQLDVDRAPISPFVAALDLNIPRNARKEFDKANEFLEKQNWTQAIGKLHQAITIYPSFAVAYNNLAVAYARLGEQIEEREALEKAISINDHLPGAYVNLARMNIAANDFAQAEVLLDKASTLDPTDAMTLVLLAYAEFMDQQLDEAIATCRRVHSMPQAHAFAHRVAARAFEEKDQTAAALAELQLFLTEEQVGPRAEAARKELAGLRSMPH